MIVEFRRINRLRFRLSKSTEKTTDSLYNKYMNEPNPDQQSNSQPVNKMSSRATNFLMMGATKSAQQTQSLNPQDLPEEVGGEAHEYSQPPPPQEYTEHPQEQRRTGVIGSTIHPAKRPGVPEHETESTPHQDQAQATGQLEQDDHPASQKKPSREERIEKLADRITDVLKKISDIKTGMLNPDIAPGQRVNLLSEKSPGLSKFLTVLIIQLEPLFLLVQRINQKLIEKNLVQAKVEVKQPEEVPENTPPPPPEKVSFLELAEKNIIFCDNRKRPLYTLEQMKGKHGYTVSEDVIAPMILEEITKAFHEVAPKAKAIPTPTSGMYAGIPMDQVMEHITEEEIMRFLSYVHHFPRGYVGKSFRITESFAGWVVSGTPDD